MRLTPLGSRGMGWHRDAPDFRDSNLDDQFIKAGEVKKKSKVALHRKSTDKIKKARATIDSTASDLVDNSQSCSPIEDQGELGACTAFAAVGMVEYMQRMSGLDHIDASQLFLYKVTRNMLGWQGDTGAYVRTAMKALALFGVPPQAYYPYDIPRFEDEPDAFLYSFAANYKALQYFRLDRSAGGNYPGRDSTKDNVLAAIKAGYAVMFGFSVYSSLSHEADIPVPTRRDKLVGGHAVLAVGYDNTRKVLDSQGNEVGEGALLIRNSWGEGWGDYGYGWLPYAYIDMGLATDFWTCTKSDWENLADGEE